MGNAAFHKKEVLQNLAVKYSQALFFLPPYSPEYNPLELKWNALNRKAISYIPKHGTVLPISLIRSAQAKLCAALRLYLCGEK